MAAENINVRVRGELQTHLQQQIGENGLYENASEYVRALIRQDLKNQTDAWEWLKNDLEPALRAAPDAYTAISADDVIQRNQVK